MAIHPTAVIDKAAQIDPSATIGPYAIIEGEVKIGAGTVIYPHAYISGYVTIGQRCQIHPGAVIGHVPQDFHFDGSRSYCVIGDGTIVREHASIHRGTQPESTTLVGRNCLIMGQSHIAHNCRIGDEVKIANMTALAGHVSVGQGVFISGACVVHQFCRIGEYAMIGGASRITMDVPSFLMCVHENECVGVNIVGLRRSGFAWEEIAEIRQAYRTLYRSGKTFRAAVAEVAAGVRTPAGQRLAEFLATPTKRGFCGASPQSASPQDADAAD